MLFSYLVLGAALVFDHLSGLIFFVPNPYSPISGSSVFGYSYVLVGLALVPPCLCVSIRRLHDIDRTGWWYLISFIPIVGSLVLLVWFCWRGVAHENRFGSDPLQQRPRSEAAA